MKNQAHFTKCVINLFYITIGENCTINWITIVMKPIILSGKLMCLEKEKEKLYAVLIVKEREISGFNLIIGTGT